jgi:hypothetical protein
LSFATFAISKMNFSNFSFFSFSRTPFKLIESPLLFSDF